MKEKKHINVAFAAILFLGASVFTTCTKGDDEKAMGVDTTGRVDKYNEMDSLVESMPFSRLQGVSVGNAQNNDAKTGVTVFFFPKASMASAVVMPAIFTPSWNMSPRALTTTATPTSKRPRRAAA